MNTAKLLYALTCVVFLMSACSTTRTTDRGGMYPCKAGPGAGVLHLRATYTAPYCGGADPGPEGMPRPGGGGRFRPVTLPDTPYLDRGSPAITGRRNNEGDRDHLNPGTWFVHELGHIHAEITGTGQGRP